MNALPLEKQVCMLEQAKKLTALLGEHAPGSLWVWRPKYRTDKDVGKYELWLRRRLLYDGNSLAIANSLAAYTDGELFRLLPFKDVLCVNEESPFGKKVYSAHYTLRSDTERPNVLHCCMPQYGYIAWVFADLAVHVLKHSQIKPDEFKY